MKKKKKWLVSTYVQEKPATRSSKDVQSTDKVERNDKGKIIKWGCRQVGCKKFFDQRQKRSRHEDKCDLPMPEKTSVKITTAEGELECSTCHHDYSDKATFSRHLQKCEKFVQKKFSQTEKSLLCEICGKKEQYPSKLKQHMKSHDRNINIFSCMICNKDFVR